MDNESSIIAESENFKNKEIFGYRELVLTQIKRVVQVYSHELVKGYWRYNVPNPGMSEIVTGYSPDTRVSFIQSLQLLHDLLLPRFDDQMKNDSKKFDDDLKDTEEKLREKKATWDDYYEKVVPLHRTLFQKLCMFLERLGWLEESSLEDD